MATHNNLKLTIEAVDCLYAHTVTPFRLVVVDDSTDKITPYYFRKIACKEHDNIRYLHSDISYTHGNQIIQVGVDNTETDIIAYLGNSTWVEPGWDEAAFQIMQNEPAIGVMGFKLLYPSSGVIEHAGMYWTPDMPHHYNFGANQAGHRYTGIREVPAVGWALVMMRRNALPEKLDVETYHGFRGYDDLDNCFEIAKRGWKIVYCGLGAAYHKAGATRNVSSDERVFTEQEENRQRFLMKWGADEAALKSVVLSKVYG